MAVTNGYCTLAELKAALRITDSVDDTLLERAIEGASRRIDGYCGRWFYQTQQTLTMNPWNEYSCPFHHDLASTTVTIKIDTAGDGTYATTLTQGTDYQLEPRDAILQGHPYRKAVMIGGQTFPLYYAPAPDTVQIIGTWGWAAVPHDVREACIMLAQRQFARLNAPLGVVGFSDMAITVRSVDPDVRDLLNPYKVLGVI